MILSKSSSDVLVEFFQSFRSQKRVENHVLTLLKRSLDRTRFKMHQPVSILQYLSVDLLKPREYFVISIIGSEVTPPFWI